MLISYQTGEEPTLVPVCYCFLWLNHERNGESMLSKTIVFHFLFGSVQKLGATSNPMQIRCEFKVLDKPISTRCIGQIRSNHVKILLLFSIHGKTMLNPASCWSGVKSRVWLAICLLHICPFFILRLNLKIGRVPRNSDCHCDLPINNHNILMRTCPLSITILYTVNIQTHCGIVCRHQYMYI